MNNGDALRRFGLRLLEDEVIVQGFDKRRAFVQNISRIKEGFVLTNQRLAYVSGGRFRPRRARASLLTDVRFLDLEQRGRSWWLLIFGVLLLPVVIGLLILWAWWRSGQTVIGTQIGSKDTEIRVSRSVRRSAEDFAADFFERKTAAAQTPQTRNETG